MKQGSLHCYLKFSAEPFISDMPKAVQCQMCVPLSNQYRIDLDSFLCWSSWGSDWYLSEIIYQTTRRHYIHHWDVFRSGGIIVVSMNCKYWESDVQVWVFIVNMQAISIKIQARARGEEQSDILAIDIMTLWGSLCNSAYLLAKLWDWSDTIWNWMGSEPWE